MPKDSKPKTCTTEGCTTDHYAKGLCRKHYNAQNHVKGLDPADRKDWPGKGLSGEPRLSNKEIEGLFRDLLPMAAERLKAILENEKSEDWAVIKVTELAAERVAGKPTQAITGPDGGPIQIQAQHLHAKLVALAEGSSGAGGQLEDGRVPALEAGTPADPEGGGETNS